MASGTLGVISDTHYSGPASFLPFDAIRSCFEEVDIILHAGDIVTEGLLSLLGTIAPVEAVYGNMDPSGITGRLPEKKVVIFAGKRIGMVHGTALLPPEDKPSYYFPGEKLDAFVFGHTHQSFSEHRNGILLFNPGSPVKPRNLSLPSVGIIRLSGDLLEGIVLSLRRDV